MSDTVKCRYAHCLHGGIINKLNDKYVLVGKATYYHKDCYQRKRSGADKDESTKEDLKKFRELWLNNINKNVVFWELNKMLNDFLDRGIPSDRLLFTLKYVIEHKYKLNYPAGFHYYVDNEEIQKAFLAKKREELMRRNAEGAKRITEKTKDDTQKFNIPKRKTIADLFT